MTPLDNQNMATVLDRISDIIREYRQSDVIKEQNGAQLNDWLKDLSGYLYYLEKERSEYHKRFEKIIYDKVSEGYSVARAENIANVQVPEMYLLRHVMDAAYRVCDAMRTNISYIKHEMNQAA